MSALPIAKPRIQAQPRLRVVEGTLPSVGTMCLQGAVAFVIVTTFVFGASSLFGHVMVEKARREGISAGRRLQTALQGQSNLAAELESLSDMARLELWAKQNGFVAPDVLPKPSGSNRVLVARH